MFKPQHSLAVILSTAAIAGSIVLSSVSSAQPCPMRKFDSYKQEKYEQTNGLNSPWVALITIPGIALATALSVGNRWYKKDL